MGSGKESFSHNSPFPSTHWSQLAKVRDPGDAQYREALDFLIRRYWKPVYSYLRRKGHPSEDAKDLTQEFFANWLAKDLFARADRNRGRFRALLLSSLDHFVANQKRAARAQRRRPAGGLVSIDELIADERGDFEPADRHTPEQAFNRAWAVELVRRVLRLFEDECRITRNEVLCELYQRRIVAPAMEGATAPPMAEIAATVGLTEKQASNRLITARRAFHRLFRAEIRLYATDEQDVAEELKDLFRFLGGE